MGEIGAAAILLLLSAITIVPLFDFDACTKRKKKQKQKKRGGSIVSRNTEEFRAVPQVQRFFDRQRSKKTGVIGFEESDRGSGIDEDTSDRQ